MNRILFVAHSNAQSRETGQSRNTTRLSFREFQPCVSHLFAQGGLLSRTDGKFTIYSAPAVPFRNRSCALSNNFRFNFAPSPATQRWPAVFPRRRDSPLPSCRLGSFRRQQNAGSGSCLSVDVAAMVCTRAETTVISQVTHIPSRSAGASLHGRREL